jgi:biopolymer transport protein ExbD
MSSRFRVLAISGAAILVACLLATVGPYVVGLTHEADSGHASAGQISQSGELPTIAQLPSGRLKSASMTALAPEAPFADQFGQQYADYENIQVDVHRDGTITVLGQTMALDALIDWLNDQRRAEINTCVSVRAEGDCQFHHVGRVIQMCQDLGVPTLMLPVTAARTPPTAKMGGPA